MPIHRSLFDPLKFLERQQLKVELSSNGQILLHGISKLPIKNRRKAKWVLDNYEKLLRMQLDAPSKELRPSVQKLIAQGKIKIEKGHYLKKYN